MDTRSITAINLESGETFNTDLKFKDNKFTVRGYKMYNASIDVLVDVLTKDELKAALKLFGSDTIDYHNLLIGPFHKLTSQMSKSTRSKFKKKLFDHGIMAECQGKLMLNPFIFLPKGDRNIRNSGHLTQRVWKYMFEDANSAGEDVVVHAEHMFGKSGVESKYLSVGSGDYQTLLPKPEST